VGRALLEIPLLWFVLPQVPIPSHGVPGGGGLGERTGAMVCPPSAPHGPVALRGRRTCTGLACSGIPHSAFRTPSVLIFILPSEAKTFGRLRGQINVCLRSGPQGPPSFWPPPPPLQRLLGGDYVLVPLNIGDRGPYNFLVDTGAPIFLSPISCLPFGLAAARQ